jgi:diphthine synthase
VLDRSAIEDGRRLLEEAKDKKVVLAIQGDPMLATTHTDLRVRATKAGIPTRVVYGATIISAAASASGVHAYKLGGVITYAGSGATRGEEVYRAVHRNLLHGLHTLILLEFDVEKDEGVAPAEVFRGLIRAEANLKRGVISNDTFGVTVSRAGWEDESVRAGTLSDLQAQDFGGPPHCVIIPGKLHFTEVEALSAITGIEEGKIGDNTRSIVSTAQALVPRYVEKTKNALKRAKEGLKGGYLDLLENVTLYTVDAERFLANGEDELAMMSIGYAEGLLQALTFTDRLEIEW